MFCYQTDISKSILLKYINVHKNKKLKIKTLQESFCVDIQVSIT